MLMVKLGGVCGEADQPFLLVLTFWASKVIFEILISSILRVCKDVHKGLGLELGIRSLGLGNQCNTRP